MLANSKIPLPPYLAFPPLLPVPEVLIIQMYLIDKMNSVLYHQNFSSYYSPSSRAADSRMGYDTYSISLTLFLCLLLLIMGMDIEVNPGPANNLKSLSMVHMNVQSLYMSSINNNPRVKLDEIITTFAISGEIDIITMSETWLHDS